MLRAVDELGNLVEPRPRARAFCPVCQSPVIAKCGALVTWHWAHQAQAECDSFGEPETEWHRQWKLAFAGLGYAIERVFTDSGETHRADVYDPQRRRVVELQHSAIDACSVWARQQFYERCAGGLVWLFDAQAWNLTLHRRDRYWSFRWRWARRSLFDAFLRPPVYLHLGGTRVLKVMRLYDDETTAGWGYLYYATDKPTLIRRLFGEVHCAESRAAHAPD